MITVKHNGQYKNAREYLERLKKYSGEHLLIKYAEEGLDALRKSTPVDSGLTAASWFYEIEKTNKGLEIVYKNSNVNDGVNIAIILQYGHGTGTGGWVVGTDYINPAIEPIFDKIVKDLAKEVGRL